MNINVLDEVLTVTEAAKRYGLNTATVRRKCADVVAADARTPHVRQSGATWLIERTWADANWQRKHEDE